MQPQIQIIADLVNSKIRSYAPDAFNDLALNRVLLMILNILDASLSGSGGGVALNIRPIVSANFINATDVPMSDLNGAGLQIYWNELQRFIYKDAGEWADLPGGGFSVTYPGFDSTAANYHFEIFVSGTSNNIGANVAPVASADFTTSIDCPIPALKGAAIEVYWDESQRFLEKDAGEWTDLPGGGFTVTIPGFDKSLANYHFYVFKR